VWWRRLQRELVPCARIARRARRLRVTVAATPVVRSVGANADSRLVRRGLLRRRRFRKAPTSVAPVSRRGQGGGFGSGRLVFMGLSASSGGRLSRYGNGFFGGCCAAPRANK